MRQVLQSQPVRLISGSRVEVSISGGFLIFVALLFLSSAISFGARTVADAIDGHAEETVKACHNLTI